MSIATNIKRLRADYKVSQQEFADAMSVTQQAVAKWEQGVSIPQADRIMEIADFFNVPVEAIMNDDDSLWHDVCIDERYKYRLTNEEYAVWKKLKAINESYDINDFLTVIQRGVVPKLVWE